MRLTSRLLVSACMTAAFVLVSPIVMANEAPAASTAAQPDDELNEIDSKEADEARGELIDNPGSIAEQFRRDRASKDYLFQFPGANLVLEPWNDFRARLGEKYGFRPSFSFTHLYQWASDTVGPNTEDDGSGLEVNIDATWDFWGRETDSPSTAGFEFLYRDKAGTDIPPVALFTQTGGLYPSTVAFGEVDPTLGQLWLQQIYKKKVGVRVGKYFPISAYDFFPLKNFRTDFLDGIHGANLVIPLPDRGLGAFAMFRPRPNIYLRAGVHDANANAEKAGFKSLFDEGELFKIFEVGVDPGLAERQPGRPPPGDIHVTFWHQDERDRDNVNDGWGFVLSGSQRFGRFLPFLRYGYAESDSRGPAPIEQMVNGGLAIDDIFGQSKDRIGIGLTWSRPSNGSLDDQGAIDAFYRVQVTPEIALTPTLQIVIDPVRNPDQDAVWVLGIRSRFTF